MMHGMYILCASTTVYQVLYCIAYFTCTLTFDLASKAALVVQLMCRFCMFYVHLRYAQRSEEKTQAALDEIQTHDHSTIDNVDMYMVSGTFHYSPLSQHIQMQHIHVHTL